ncbi:unnamed protein product [Rotaria sp. Silwood1]|nr:unnamed protein product [Rotaria sp. Silwood1]
MTKSFLVTLIIKRDLGVVNVSSISGFLVGPSTAAYGASKYALESFSDCLRREMSVSGNNAIMKMAENPNEVIEALQHAVMNTRSKVRYRPGWQSSLLFFPLSMCPVWLVDFLMDMGHDKRVISADVRKQLKKDYGIVKYTSMVRPSFSFFRLVDNGHIYQAI